MKKNVYLFLAVILAGVLLAGCGSKADARQENAENSEYCYYEINSSETDILRRPYAPEQETADFMIPDLMARLNNKETPEDAINLLPSEVQINSYEIAENVLNISFNVKYSNMSRARELLVRAGLVRTFVSVPGIEKVKFFIGSDELTDSKGQPMGEMTAERFVALTGSDSDAYCRDTFTLYFTDGEGRKLVPEKRDVYYKSTMPRERVVLEQLALGPMEKGHYPTVQENTAVLAVTTADRTCYVNLSETFVHAALPVTEEVAVYSVVNSLLALQNADRVQILINGNDEAVFGENMQLYQFYEWNEDLIFQAE